MNHESNDDNTRLGNQSIAWKEQIGSIKAKMKNIIV